MEGDTAACDKEIADIVKDEAVISSVTGTEDCIFVEMEDTLPQRTQEPEIARAAQLSSTELNNELPKLISRLRAEEDSKDGSNESSSSSGGSNKSGSGSPKTRTSAAPSITGETRGEPAADSSFRLKLGGFSGRSSRKGSSCSTPVSSLRTEMDYPSPNFIRPALVGCQEVSIDEGTKLTIKLHYNPVMDEWVSLTEDAVHKEVQDIDILFDLHKTDGIGMSEEDEEIIRIGNFLNALESTGLRRTNPRLEVMMKQLEQLRRERSVMSIESLQLGRQAFNSAVNSNINLLSRAFKGQFVVPEFGHFCKQITDIYEHCKSNVDGQVASYIPQLARYKPEYWGVSICTVDGQRFSLGNVDIPFTLQSSSKPFTYAVCLNELGTDTVHQYVGQEPSGRMFNELSLDFNNKPHNPLLNSGAIMSCAILLNLIHQEMKMSEKFDFVTEYLRKIAGGEFVSFNNSVFLSERETADRNFALAYYMKENNCFPKGFILQECLDFYFQTCSMEVNCDTLAVMGATLANGGVCPTTGETALNPGAVRDVLSLMHSCGMYNYSGQFAFDVGLPAKSGVSGALVLVIPNVMGIGLWSPPLDALGNTVRGVLFAKELVKFFNFHRFDNLITQNIKKIDPRKFKDEHKRQSTLCLLYSATTGDLTALKRFYYSGVDMKATNYDGRTALHLAAAEGHSSCVRFLLENCQMDPLAKDRWGFTPLVEAKRFQHDLVFRYLAKHVEDNYPEAVDELLAQEE